MRHKRTGLLAAALLGGTAASAQAGVPLLVLPFRSSLTTAQPLPVAVAVAAVSGTVTLTSGAYRSAPTPLFDGVGVVAIPAGVLPPGSDGLAVQFTPAGAAAPAASGGATVAVTEAAPPAIAARTTSTLATVGDPVSALPGKGRLVVSTTADGEVAGTRTGIEVFSGSAAHGYAESCVQALPPVVTAVDGLAFTPDDTGLLAAVEEPGLAILPAAAVRSGCDAPSTIVYQGPAPAEDDRENTFAVAATPDNRFALVANEYGIFANGTEPDLVGNLGVVALTRDAAGAIAGGMLAGQLATGGSAVASVTVSPDGTRAYVTSENKYAATEPAGATNPVLAPACTSPTTGAPVSYGLVTIVDLTVLEADPAAPAAALIARVAAGCSPVRTAETADGNVLWVADRGSNTVLALSTHMLETDPADAVLDRANTGGIAPVGLQLFGGDRLLAVANSNRFAPGADGNLTILDATAVAPRVVATVATGEFPRNLSKGADDRTLFLTDYASREVQVIATGSGPRAGTATGG